MVATSRQRAVVIAAPPGVLDDECAAAVEDHQRVTLFDDVGGGAGEGAASWAGTCNGRGRLDAAMAATRPTLMDVSRAFPREIRSPSG